MELTASNGSAFNLKILGYQFPKIENDKWDSNWLIIQIFVSHPQGNWTISDPCLLTFEVARLADWLESISECKDVDPTESFLEPNLEFHLVQDQSKSKALRVCFQLELRPPWVKSNIVDECDLWVEFPLDEIDLKAASQELRKQLEPFPIRAR